MNKNFTHRDKKSLILFIDMNSFFATCEQQVNYWLRKRPIAVCVYTGKHGCIIAPSIEAKAQGIKLGMRLNEAMKVCPDLIPVETHPNRYREFHIKMINVLKKYSEDVIPKSIDEAIVNLSGYHLIYPDPLKVAEAIRNDIKREVGEWMKCSIGIAPNAFLAKLASNIKKPEGLAVISEANIDEVLQKMCLTDLPGISRGMSTRLINAGITTPLAIRYATPEKLKHACKSVVGLHWHYRLNFGEVDLADHRYKSMQARRMISLAQRRSVNTLHNLFITLCQTLERRMIKEKVYCQKIIMHITYADANPWKTEIDTGKPVQDGMEIMNLLKQRMSKFSSLMHSESVINVNLTSMGVTVTDFVHDELIQYHLFENSIRKDNLRKLVYDLKDKYGTDKIMRAIELKDEEVWRDAIGFGSVKDLHSHSD